MAKKVTVEISGGAPQVIDDVDTIADVKRKFGKDSYVAKLNGEAAEDEDELDDYAHVSLAENVKGGQR